MGLFFQIHSDDIVQTFFSEKKGGPDFLGGKSVSFIRDYNKLVKL